MALKSKPIHYVYVSDDDGHNYMIPEKLKSKFHKDLEKGEADEYENFNATFSGMRIDGADEAFMPASLLTIYYGYVGATYSTVFLDSNKKYISDIHENDGDYRSEYFDPVFKAVGVTMKLVSFDKILPESVQEDLANYTLMLDKVDFTKYDF